MISAYRRNGWQWRKAKMAWPQWKSWRYQCGGGVFGKQIMAVKALKASAVAKNAGGGNGVSNGSWRNNEN
jgi:hypothetical protein